MEELKFEELELCPEILKAVKHMGFEEASPIQSKAIPVIMSGKDVIGQAQTGTGKTAAFGIPLLEKIDPKNKKLQAIVLCPTRELAIQVAEEIRNLAKYMHGIKVLPIYGGQEIVKQIRSLKSGTQLVIGTPGRVMDHMRRKTMKWIMCIRLCWMRRMRCSTWDSVRILRQFWKEFHRNTRQCFFCDNAKGNLRDHKTVPDKCGTGEGDEERAHRSEH